MGNWQVISHNLSLTVLKTFPASSKTPPSCQNRNIQSSDEDFIQFPHATSYLQTEMTTRGDTRFFLVVTNNHRVFYLSGSFIYIYLIFYRMSVNDKVFVFWVARSVASGHIMAPTEAKNLMSKVFNTFRPSAGQILIRGNAEH